jgi:3-deoxy-D-arabino-heptulosonate 7-phosphate (DAHP) synthase class II
MLQPSKQRGCPAPPSGLFSGLLKRCNPPLQTVTWVCDPMHGNTETVSNYKTRRYENIRAEVWALCCAQTRSRHRCAVCELVFGFDASLASTSDGVQHALLQVEAFFDVHEEMGTVPGGLHLEMTGDNVTECIGGGSGVTGTTRCILAAACIPACPAPRARACIS